MKNIPFKNTINHTGFQNIPIIIAYKPLNFTFLLHYFLKCVYWKYLVLYNNFMLVITHEPEREMYMMAKAYYLKKDPGMDKHIAILNITLVMTLESTTLLMIPSLGANIQTSTSRRK